MVAEMEGLLHEKDAGLREKLHPEKCEPVHLSYNDKLLYYACGSVRPSHLEFDVPTTCLIECLRG